MKTSVMIMVWTVRIIAEVTESIMFDDTTANKIKMSFSSSVIFQEICHFNLF